LRKRKKLTQTQVGEKIGITPQAISKWERGESFPDISLWPILSDIYETTIDLILAPNNIASVVKNINIVSENIFKEMQQDLNLDLFVYLNEWQKTEMIAYLLSLENYEKYIHEIIPHTTLSHRELIVIEILEKEHFYKLEEIAPYIPKALNDVIISFLLKKSAYETLENLEPFFTKTQKELINQIERGEQNERKT
jgi:transcriptional regulator with XRE-family HTH domain